MHHVAHTRPLVCSAQGWSQAHRREVDITPGKPDGAFLLEANPPLNTQVVTPFSSPATRDPVFPKSPLEELWAHLSSACQQRGKEVTNQTNSQGHGAHNQAPEPAGLGPPRSRGCAPGGGAEPLQGGAEL